MHSSSPIRNIFRLWRYVGRKRQAQFFLLFFLMTCSVIAEMFNIAAVIPFLSALTAPEALIENEAGWIQGILHLLNVQSADNLLPVLTLLFIAASICAVSMRIFQLWFNTRLSTALGIQLRDEIYTKTLCQPYTFHLQQNSSTLISLATGKAATAIQVGIMQVLQLLTNCIMSCTIICTLLFINAGIAVSACILLGGGYISIAYLVRKRIGKNSIILSQTGPKTVQCIQEGLGGVREVIIDGSQKIFSSSHVRVVRDMQRASMQNTFLAGLPKPLLEMTAVTLITLLAYSLHSDSSGQQNVLPLLGAFALGAQRLLPAMQQIYMAWSSIIGQQAILDDVVTALYQEAECPKTGAAPLPFTHSIALQHVTCRYPGAEKNVLQDITLHIPQGSTTGFIGTTGSGKSTLLDIIMGLLPPLHGQLLVDDAVIDSTNIRAWQQNIAHVSQSIFLSDTSVEENIAFGVPKDQIDPEQVQRAAQQAQIHTFIENLPSGYQTHVGERGIRLSGGQRQRIGIARALYKQAPVLVLDEATSALDEETEKAVMASINGLGEITLLIIAHRLSTLERCDRIVKLADGQIAEHNG